MSTAIGVSSTRTAAYVHPGSWARAHSWNGASASGGRGSS